MELMYWITRLDVIVIICAIAAVIFAAILIVALLVGLLNRDLMDEEEELMCSKCIKTSIICCVVFGVIAVFVPTTKDALLIYGIGGTVEYLESNDKAKELPDKAIEALNAYLDEINEEKTKEE